jgi:hypothetical protein
MRPHTILRLGSALLSVALAACQASGVAAYAETRSWQQDEAGAPDDVGAGLASTNFADTDDDGLPDARTAAAGERMMIYRGAMTIEVARAEDAIPEFLARVAAWGGYLSAQQDRRLTVRLPSPRFDEAMNALRGIGRVLAESRQADDVSRQYVDLGIRLDNARRGRERLLELLAKAAAVEDMLAIEKELRRLTEEIERMEGEMKFLADQVALATLQVEFRSVAAPGPQQRKRRPSRFGWIDRIGVDALREAF